MTKQEAIERAKKLLALANNNDNPHEAAVAASRAHEVMLRFALTESEIGGDATVGAASRPRPEPRPDQTIRIDPVPLEPGGERKRAAAWKIQLAMVIANHCNCRIILRARGIYVVGSPDNTQEVRTLYQFLYNEIERLTKWRGTGLGMLWQNNYRLGAIKAVNEVFEARRVQLVDELRRERAETHALALLETRLMAMDEERRAVDAYVAHVATRGRPIKGSQVNADAQMKGYVDGKQHIKL